MRHKRKGKAMIDSEIEKLDGQVKLMKSRFERLIAETSIPLETRWRLFCDSPDYLKNHKTWIVDIRLHGEEIHWYDDFYINRHQTVDMKDIVEHLEEIDQDLAAFKEEILAKNLGSFVYDW